MQTHLQDKLARRFKPTHLEVIDESGQHNVPAGAESRSRVTLINETFADIRLLARHRVVNKALAEELAGPIRALALHTYSPTDWAARAEIPASPPCLERGR